MDGIVTYIAERYEVMGMVLLIIEVLIGGMMQCDGDPVITLPPSAAVAPLLEYLLIQVKAEHLPFLRLYIALVLLIVVVLVPSPFLGRVAPRHWSFYHVLLLIYT